MKFIIKTGFEHILLDSILVPPGLNEQIRREVASIKFIGATPLFEQSQIRGQNTGVQLLYIDLESIGS